MENIKQGISNYEVNRLLYRTEYGISGTDLGSICNGRKERTSRSIHCQYQGLQDNAWQGYGPKDNGFVSEFPSGTIDNNSPQR